MSQTVLATRANVPQSMLSDFETGKRLCYTKAQVRIARALGVKVEDLGIGK